MPISREEFQRAEKSIDERILEYLSSNGAQAFDVVEIIAACEEVSYSSDFGAVALLMRYEKEYNAAFERLLEKNLVKAGRIGGGIYYGIS